MSKTIATLLVCSALATSGDARGSDTACPPHGVLRTRVTRFDDESLTRRVLDQVFSELAKRSAACPPGNDAPVQLTIRWRDGGHVLVAFEALTAKRLLTMERDVDLARVPRDGTPLAVAIVADELYGELLEHLALDLPEATLPRRVPRHAPSRARPAESHDAWRLGVRFTHEQLTSGLGLTGIDVELAWKPTRHFDLAMRGGPRAVSFVSDVRGKAFDVALVASVTTDARAVRGIGVTGAFDVLGAGSIVTVAPSLGVSVWQRVGHRFLFTLDVRAGAGLRSRVENSRFDGAMVTSSIGFATEW